MRTVSGLTRRHGGRSDMRMFKLYLNTQKNNIHREPPPGASSYRRAVYSAAERVCPPRSRTSHRRSYMQPVGQTSRSYSSPIRLEIAAPRPGPGDRTHDRLREHRQRLQCRRTATPRGARARARTHSYTAARAPSAAETSTSPSASSGGALAPPMMWPSPKSLLRTVACFEFVAKRTAWFALGRKR